MEPKGKYYVKVGNKIHSKSRPMLGNVRMCSSLELKKNYVFCRTPYNKLYHHCMYNPK